MVIVWPRCNLILVTAEWFPYRNELPEVGCQANAVPCTFSSLVVVRDVRLITRTKCEKKTSLYSGSEMKFVMT